VVSIAPLIASALARFIADSAAGDANPIPDREQSYEPAKTLS
jgi:hypothetical protein